MNEQTSIMSLGKRKRGTIVGFSDADPELVVRLREIGFTEGDVIVILHTGLFGHSPINIKLHGTSIAMRRKEARSIFVEAVDV